MAQRNEKVLDRVRQEMTKNPSLGSKELYDVALTVDKAIGQDTLQQFHARYYLPIKREQSGAVGGRKKKAVKKTAPRKGRVRAAKVEKVVEEQPAAANEAPVRRRGRRKQADVGSLPSANRDQIRSLLLQFAQELTDAESRSSLVKVLGRVDSYVDRVAKSGS